MYNNYLFKCNVLLFFLLLFFSCSEMPFNNDTDPYNENFETPVLNASRGSYSAYVLLKWENNDCVSQYVIYRSGNKKNQGSKIMSLPGDQDYYEDNDADLIKGRIYYYRLKAKLKSGIYTDTSDSAAGYLSIESPFYFSASQGDFTGKIRLTWNDNNENCIYIIERAESEEGPFYTIVDKDVTYDNKYYDDTKIIAGKKYYYKFRSCIKGKDCISDYSNEIQGYAKLESPVLNSVSSGYPETGGIQLDFSWIKDAQEYVIYRRNTDINNDEWEPVQSNLTGNTFFDESAEPVYKYEYKVQAVSSDGITGDFSNTKKGFYFQEYYSRNASFSINTPDTMSNITSIILNNNYLYVSFTIGKYNSCVAKYDLNSSGLLIPETSAILPGFMSSIVVCNNVIYASYFDKTILTGIDFDLNIISDIYLKNESGMPLNRTFSASASFNNIYYAWDYMENKIYKSFIDNNPGTISCKCIIDYNDSGDLINGELPYFGIAVNSSTGNIYFGKNNFIYKCPVNNNSLIDVIPGGIYDLFKDKTGDIYSFNNIGRIFIDDKNNLYIVDSGSGCIKKFDKDNKLISLIGIEDNLVNLNGITVDTNGNIYASEVWGGEIHLFNKME